MQLAATQHRAVSTAQLAQIGVTRRWLENLVRRSVLHRVGAGVYVVGGAAPTWHHRLTVGMLVLAGDAWASHEAAAALRRFDRAHRQVPTERADVSVFGRDFSVSDVPDWPVAKRRLSRRSDSSIGGA